MRYLIYVISELGCISLCQLTITSLAKYKKKAKERRMCQCLIIRAWIEEPVTNENSRFHSPKLLVNFSFGSEHMALQKCENCHSFHMTLFVTDKESANFPTGENKDTHMNCSLYFYKKIVLLMKSEFQYRQRPCNFRALSCRHACILTQRHNRDGTLRNNDYCRQASVQVTYDVMKISHSFQDETVDLIDTSMRTCVNTGFIIMFK